MGRMIRLNAAAMGRLFIVVSLLFVGLATASRVSADDRGFRGECGKERQFFQRGRGDGARLFAKLDLNDSQKTAIREIWESTAKDMIKKKADIKIAKLELREMLRKEPVNMRAVESQVKKIQGLKASMMLDRIKSREEIKSKLTPEQREKFKELVRDSMMHGGFHRHRS